MSMRGVAAAIVVASMSVFVSTARGLDAQNQGAAETGERVYASSCARCHEAGVARAGNRTALGLMSAENIRFALTNGVMRSEAAQLTPAQVDLVVAFLAARPSATPAGASAANLCAANTPPADPMAQPHWIGWGADLTQRRFQPAAMAQLAPGDVPRLALKWAFGFSGVRQAYGQPTVVGGRLFVGSAERKVHSLDVRSGCRYWTFDSEFPVRTAITVDVAGANWVAYFGDQHATVYAVDAVTGTLRWKRRVDDHPTAVVTGAPTLSAGVLYVPVSSSEEGAGTDPKYGCCTFRGAVAALDAASGSVKWKAYTIAEPAQPVRQNSQGVQLFGPSGAAVWGAPTIDLKLRRVYVTTGDSYSDPAATTSDAFMAFDADTGKMIWARQMTAGDAFTMACDLPGPLAINCPVAKGPDHDFGSSPILVDLPNGRRALIAGQKSGVVHALDPDRDGAILWQRRVGKGGRVGGVQWGSASDGSRVYVALSDAAMELPQPGSKGAQQTMLGIPLLLNPESGGGLFALDAETGAIAWNTPHPGCRGEPGCSPSQSAAVTMIPGVLFSGGLDGHLRAYAAADGKIVWDVDTKREYQTVNGVAARGGALDGPGAVVVGGMLFVNSGYSFIGGAPGNVLLAFSVDGR